jgi:tetratricopeptide (TPR) repeat protein
MRRTFSNPKLSRGRKWLFGLTVTVFAPLLLLCVVEAGLRIAGYGYPTSFFKPLRIKNEDFFVENDKFGLRFFPPALARSPAPVLMRAKKAPGTYRIFILGESAALGDPRPAYGAGRYLQVLLEERFAKARFEVICTAVTAINSHAILPIARECAKHDGDLWIVYMGNNEMVGPFGATTVFGARAPPWWQVRMGLAMQRLRVGQLLMQGVRRMTGASKSAPSWFGMQLFMEQKVAPGERRKEAVYANFGRNLADILQTGRSSGAKLILSTVAVNLKDCAPFASVSGAGLSETQRSEVQKLTLDGSAAESRGDLAQAAQCFRRAATLDTNNAESQFRLGDCLLKLTNAPAARECLVQARDLDALPFRADSRINESISNAAKTFGGSHLAFFDAVAYFATNSAVGIPGEESFYEHVHFNFDGNYRLALGLGEQVERLLPDSILKAKAAGWASQAKCEEQLGLTDWNRVSVLDNVLRRLSQPPFTGQLNHTQQMAAVEAQIREIRQRMDSSAAARAREIYTQAIKREPDDFRLHENFAEFLEAIGELPQATGEWQAVRELIPHHHVAYFQVGRLLARQGKLTEAEGFLQQSLAFRPDLAEGWLELGKVHATEGKPEVALQDLERARVLIPQDHRVYYHMGTALLKLKRRPEAIEQFREAIKRNSEDWEAHYALGEEIAFDGKTEDARREFELVTRLKPNYAMAHLNLGVALVKEGELDNASREFEETLRLQPQNPLAADYLRQLRERKKQNVEPLHH